MCNKQFFLDQYFEYWRRNIDRAGMLLVNPEHHIEGWLVLSCYLGAFAAMRFPSIKEDGKRYVKIVLEYSGKRDLFEKIDLLFLYQWPQSKLRNHGCYKSFKNYNDDVTVLKGIYGDENAVKQGTRYIPQREVISYLMPEKLCTPNCLQKLPLFSLAELLYRYVRCDAVHNAEFPFLNDRTGQNGDITYVPNHLITGDVIFETTKGVLVMLSEECRRTCKFPQEL